MMSQYDITSLKNYYNTLFQKFGVDSRSTGYSPEGQKIRYEVLSQIENLEGKKILEIGSGLGHFFSYLKSKFTEIDYTGFDINENFIRESRNLYGNIFHVRNIIDEPVQDEYDVVFSVGILNTPVKNNIDTTLELMKAMYRSCRDFAALSMTSIYVDPAYRYPENYYYDPTMIFCQGKTISRNIRLYHDYLPHDFTIVLFKR